MLIHQYKLTIEAVKISLYNNVDINAKCTIKIKRIAIFKYVNKFSNSERFTSGIATLSFAPPHNIYTFSISKNLSTFESFSEIFSFYYIKYKIKV